MTANPPPSSALDVVFSLVTQAGIPFNVRLVEPGDRYGLDRCLVNDKDATQIEFYDARYSAAAGNTRFDPLGQFVSRYYVDTLMDAFGSSGLILDGGTPSWVIDAKSLTEALSWALSHAANINLSVALKKGLRVGIYDSEGEIIEEDELAENQTLLANGEKEQLVNLKHHGMTRLSDIRFEHGRYARWEDVNLFDAIYLWENSEQGDLPMTKAEFIIKMNGCEDAAKELYYLCEWQSPDTVLDEMGTDFFVEVNP